MENETLNNENGEQILFEYAVPYNHPLQVTARAKMRTFVGIFLLAMSAIFAFAGFMALPEVFAVAIFWGFAVAFVIIGNISLMLKKPAEKHNDKNINFTFYDYGMTVISEAGFGKKLGDTRCLYNKYKDKQFIQSITEMTNLFLFKVYTGTVDGVPQYKTYYLPKDIVQNKNEEAQLKEFLVSQKQDKYIVKEKLYK